MKKLICLFALVLGFIFTASSAMASGCPKIIFYGTTLDHKKEVLVCLVGQDKLYYSFGKVRAPKPELSFWATPSTSNWGEGEDEGADVSEVNLMNGNYTYSVSYGWDYKGNPFAGINVYKDYKNIAIIPIDTNGYIGNVLGLRKSDFPETDDFQ